MATGLYMLQDGSVMVAYGPRHKAGSARKQAASGRTDVRAIAVIPLRAQNSPRRSSGTIVYSLRVGSPSTQGSALSGLNRAKGVHTAARCKRPQLF
jgi:hypothetical protein